MGHIVFKVTLDSQFYSCLSEVLRLFRNKIRVVHLSFIIFLQNHYFTIGLQLMVHIHTYPVRNMKSMLTLKSVFAAKTKGGHFDYLFLILLKTQTQNIQPIFLCEIVQGRDFRMNYFSTTH